MQPRGCGPGQHRGLSSRATKAPTVTGASPSHSLWKPSQGGREACRGTRPPTSQPRAPRSPLHTRRDGGLTCTGAAHSTPPLICLRNQSPFPQPLWVASLSPQGSLDPALRRLAAASANIPRVIFQEQPQAITGFARQASRGTGSPTPVPHGSLMGGRVPPRIQTPHISALPARLLRPGPPPWPRHCPPDACPVGPPGHPAAHHRGAPQEPTSQLLQGVVAVFLRAGEVAAAVKEVGPGHVNGVEGGLAGLAQRPADVAAGSPHTAALAARGQHGAAQQAQVGVALALQEVVQHAQQDVLGAGLHGRPGPVLQQRGEGRPVVGDVAAALELQVHARGWWGGDGGVTRALPPTMASPPGCAQTPAY